MTILHRLVLGATSALLVACATTPSIPPPPSGHPGSPQALEAPLPERRLLVGEVRPMSEALDAPEAPAPAPEHDHGGVR